LQDQPQVTRKKAQEVASLQAQKEVLVGALLLGRTVLTRELLQNSRLISFTTSQWRIQTSSCGKTVLSYLPCPLFLPSVISSVFTTNKEERIF